MGALRWINYSLNYVKMKITQIHQINLPKLYIF